MLRRPTVLAFAACSTLLFACGGDDTPPSCAPDLPPDGDVTGHPAPLGAGAGEARAGRITAASQLPATTLGLETWTVGDYVLANDKVAMVIEDVGDSQLYDPWGGRPVGIALVRDGALVSPADFGEFFILVGRTTVVTEAVTVVNDGSDGQPALIRARGRLAPLPFLDPLVSGFLADNFRDVEAAIDYSLAPGAEVVEIALHVTSGREGDTPSGTQIHGLMYTDRMKAAVPGLGFTSNIAGATWAQLVDDDGASWAYAAAGEPLGGSIAQSGFIGALNSQYNIPSCALTTRAHARIAIGGPGLDGLNASMARTESRTLRAITGTVTGVPTGSTARVHATTMTGTTETYLTRAPVEPSGNFTLHVPTATAVTLTVVTPGGPLATAAVAADATTAAITLPLMATLQIDRVVDDAGATIPARIQVMPDVTGPALIDVPDFFGEPEPPGGRFAVQFHDGSPMRIPLAPGAYHIVVSRGPEYELFEADIDADAGQAFPLAPVLDRVIDTTGTMCGDFHVHTIRSNDADDVALDKLQSAMADGVEILLRSDHEWVDDFQPLIEARAYEAWVAGIGSIEMTSFQIWGHFGVFPLDPDPAQVNNGAPKWQTFPTAAAPDGDVVTLGPVAVFDAVRARPERPTIIINHPVDVGGSTDYFDYVGLDPVTGLVEKPEDWDEDFTLVEVFNSGGWEGNDTVPSWFAILNSGRPMFAVGSSDSHSLKGSPVGYPRTCIDLGSDDPRQATGELVRDRLAAGHATISGGVYVDAAVGTARPGDTIAGGATADVAIQVQAASWLDVTTLEVVVDGETVATIPITAADADPINPAVRWQDVVTVDVAAGGSWVVVAAYGDDDMSPVHPGRDAFGVTNPIFLTR